MHTINYPDTLRKGKTGTVVKWLQSLLVSCRYAISIDGDFGTNTRNAVEAFQKARSLKVDGEVGPKTWGALLRDVVQYRQFDAIWAGIPFTATGDKSQTIKSSGCGPTCAAMVAATLKEAKVTPVEECAAAIAGGYRTSNSGVSHSYFIDVAKRFGLKLTNPSSADGAAEVLSRGGLVIASMGPGQFTNGGHFILLWAYDPYSKVFYVADPGSSQTARTRGKLSVISSQSKKFFGFEA